MTMGEPHAVENDFEHALQAIRLGGKSFVADLTGALYWPGEETVIVADLHFEKGSAFAERGAFLPPYDTRSTLGRLRDVIDRFEPRVVIALGDSFHDLGGPERIDPLDLEQLHGLQAGRRWIWVRGNHDPDIPKLCGGEVQSSVTINGVALRHAPPPAAPLLEIAGHLHPAARIRIHGHRLRRPCFVSNGRRLILPAFGAFTGGLNILDDAILDLFAGDGLNVWLLGREGIYPVSPRQLCSD